LVINVLSIHDARSETEDEHLRLETCRGI